jgi:hypothetical protein
MCVSKALTTQAGRTGSFAEVVVKVGFNYFLVL